MDVLLVRFFEVAGNDIVVCLKLCTTDRTDPRVSLVGRIAVGAAEHVGEVVFRASLRTAGSAALSNFAPGEDVAVNRLATAKKLTAEWTRPQNFKAVPGPVRHPVCKVRVVTPAQPDDGEQKEADDNGKQGKYDPLHPSTIGKSGAVIHSGTCRLEFVLQ